MKDFPLNNPLLTQEQYDQMYAESFADKEQFWTGLIRAEFGQARGSFRFNFHKRFKFYQT